MSSREQILAAVRTALKDVPAVPEIPRNYRLDGEAGAQQRIEILVDRLEDYKAGVTVVDGDAVAAAIRRLLAGAASYVVPAGLDPAWLDWETEPARIKYDGGAHGVRSVAELDATDAVVTSSAVTVAESGTIILDGSPDQGRRAISLIPDHHVCVVHTRDITAILPEALRRLDGTRPLTMISGPSATSDIELERVEGVHGPRRLDVIVVRQGCVR
ncbi:L-lactate dehydrogenase complex protein LldG [Arthrobacter sp. B2I5]|uniref:LutC/YkgG family protein n=1 Tax=Arthrobacter sp. B2I5 TaxID=3042266 RepID=UPI002782D064|nr:LUD domain-containing protein [Arthrobacter sp. B2I5]MDQ0824376.1 L-lactate dehydrogenase complex protein LldG [Arthrobacter sp. B2I5]